MESLAESKSWKWMILKWWQWISKKFKETKVFWVWCTSIVTRKSRKWQRVKETEAWNSGAGNGNESCTVSTGTTIVTEMMVIIKKQAVNTYILVFWIHFWICKYVRCSAIQYFDENTLIPHFLIYFPFQNVNKSIHGLYFGNLQMFQTSIFKWFVNVL